MVCREPLLGGTETFGMETVRAFGSAYWFGHQSGREGPWVAPLFTAGNLFYLAILTYLAGKRAPGRTSLLRHLITAYMTITGIVELTRFIWDVSRFALVWAALHNLAEWGVIGFLFFKAKEAEAHWWRSQLWVLLVSQVILFAPTITEGGGFEQIVGLLCDWLLLIMWSILYHRSDARKRKYVLWGLFGAIGHMAEILPLVSLLIGLVKVPSTEGCLLISFTTPITFYCYGRMVQGWDESGDEDLVTSKANGNGKAQDLSMPMKDVARLIFIALLLSVTTIIGPTKVIPLCPTNDMKVSPGQVLPSGASVAPVVSALTGTASGNPKDGGVPGAAALTSATYAGGPTAARASNESLCASHTKLTGTTTVVAKPGQGEVLRDMIATMPGPIRQEDGNLYYEEAWGGDGGLTVKFFESWSSIRSLYKHIYTSPAVARVFFSEAFANIRASQVLEGPFKAMIPCSEAAMEAEPVRLPMSVMMEAPVECLWARINDWSGDNTWVQGSQGITPVTPALRILHFKTTDVPVIRQTAPLPEPEQPPNGHRLIYYMLGGGFMDTLGEVYSGDLSIVPSTADPSKTLFTYTATIVAKHPSLTAAYQDSITSDFNNNRIPFLANWARWVAATPQCKAITQKAATPTPSPTPPSPTPTPVPTPVPSTPPPPAASATSDWFYTFELPAGRPATPDTVSLLRYLLSAHPAPAGPAPEVLYAANVGARNFPAAHVTGPNMKKKWDVTLVIRFPVGCAVQPGAVGAGVAVDTYRVEVRPKGLPSEQIAAQCPDSPQLDQAIAAVRGDVDAMFGNFHAWYKMLQEDPSSPQLPVKPHESMSGINLLTYKHDSGVIGQPCYQRYLLEAYKLIHGYGGGLYYFGDMVQDPAGGWQWGEIVIPLYNDGNVFFKVVFDPKYYGLLGLRDATLTDQANIDVTALPGSVMLIP